MGWLILGLVVFLGMHSISAVALPLRDSLARRLGEQPWKGVYSLVSIAGFVLLIWGFGQARMQPQVLWTPPTFMRHITLLLMLPVFPLALASLLPGRIQTVTKNPLLIATKTWALAHLLANGSLHHVLLFGAFLAWAVLVRISLKRRPKRAVPGAPATPFNDAIAVVGGLALYALFLFKLHAAWIGVAPLPALGA